MTEPLRILVTDDEPGMRMAVTRALRDYHVRPADVDDEVAFVVEEAATGEDALAKITGGTPPHILLLDYKLPGMSGIDVLERLPEEIAGEMLVIMITAYATLETAVTATKRGAYDFLAKPFTPEELKSVVRKAASRILLIRQARRLAEEKRQVRFQFIRVLTHELKAPLAAVEGYIQIMDNRTLGSDLGEYDKIIGRSLVRLEGMRKMIVDLLDLTRIESGEKQRVIGDVDVTDIARRSIETMLPMAEERSIAIDLHCDGPVMLPADPGEIEIICNNLISNAVKYNRDGGRVDVTIGGDGDSVELRVADTGIGMAPEDTAKLFNDFVRIKNEQTRSILGSGLGLSILKKLVQLYGGDVRVESAPGEGSTFTVTLRRGQD